MARAILDVVVRTVAGRTVQGAEVTVRTPDTSTPVAITMYEGKIGLNELDNPLVTDQDGRIVAYADTAQRVDLLVTGGGIDGLVYEEAAFEYDPADLLTAGDLDLKANRAGDTFTGQIVITAGGLVVDQDGIQVDGDSVITGQLQVTDLLTPAGGINVTGGTVNFPSGSIPLDDLDETGATEGEVITHVGGTWVPQAPPAIGDHTIDDTVVPTTDGPHTFAVLFNSLANRVKAAVGGADWFTAPAATLAALNTSLTADIAALAAALHATTGHAHTGVTGQGPVITGTAASADPPTSDAHITAKSLVKFWAFVTISAGSPTLALDYNVSGITDNGVGDFTVSIDRDGSSANWAPFGMSLSSSSLNNVVSWISLAAGSIRVRVARSDTNAANDDNFSVGGFGVLS